MASTSLPHQTHKPNDSLATSTFLSTVCLHDWWLIYTEEEVQGKRLGVAGFTSPKKDRVKQAVRVFKSAPIIRVYDSSTLETADGICVILNGFMNKSLTAENGFSPEASQHFIFGFPLNWEKVVAEQQYSSAAISTSPDTNSRVPDQSSPSKKDQKSASQPNNLKSDRQPCATTKRNYPAENAKDYPSSGLPKGGLEETREEPSSATPLAEPMRSSCEIGNLEEGSFNREEIIFAGIIRNLQDPSSALLCEDMSSDVLGQSSPCKEDQKKASKLSESQSGGQHCSTENTKNFPGSALFKDASDKSPEEPSSTPLAKLRSSSCQIRGTLEDGNPKGVPIPMDHNPQSHIFELFSRDSDYAMSKDQSTPGKMSHPVSGEVSLPKCKNQPRAKTNRNCSTKKAKDSPGSGNYENRDETRKDSSSAPPLAKTRKSHRTGSLEEGNAKGEKTPADTAPHFQGMVKAADSFKRSRSGRILMPRLEFWRNELPIYDVDRKLAGVQSPDLADSRDSGDVSRRRK